MTHWGCVASEWVPWTSAKALTAAAPILHSPSAAGTAQHRRGSRASPNFNLESTSTCTSTIHPVPHQLMTKLRHIHGNNSLGQGHEWSGVTETNTWTSSMSWLQMIHSSSTTTTHSTHKWIFVSVKKQPAFSACNGNHRPWVSLATQIAYQQLRHAGPHARRHVIDVRIKHLHLCRH